MRRRLLRALVVLVVLAVAAWGGASVDRCGAWQPTPPSLVGIGRAAGPLRVGAAVVAIAPKYPVTLGGYGPPRPLVERAAQPVHARATVVEIGGQRFALVALDTLLVTSALRASLQQATGVTTWLAATHTHSSLGGYDPRLASEVAALGRYDAAQEDALLTAAKAAVAQATSQLAPARLDVVTSEAPGLNVARSGSDVERALTRVRFTGAHGPIAQWVVFSAHPTLVPRRADALDPDWPGRLAARLERDGGPVTLVLQGGGGNASVDRTNAATPDAFAEALAARLSTLGAGASLDTHGAAKPGGGAVVPATSDASGGASGGASGTSSDTRGLANTGDGASDAQVANSASAAQAAARSRVTNTPGAANVADSASDERAGVGGGVADTRGAASAADGASDAQAGAGSRVANAPGAANVADSASDERAGVGGGVADTRGAASAADGASDAQAAARSRVTNTPGAANVADSASDERAGVGGGVADTRGAASAADTSSGARAAASGDDSAAARATAFTPDAALELAWADVVFALPRPDATRLVPGPLRAAAENALCEDAEHEALVSAVRLGRFTFLFAPLEPSAEAARVLTEQAGAVRVLSNANGYLGYVEPEGVAREGAGESKKQYFDAGFLQRLADAARLAGQAVAPPR